MPTELEKRLDVARSAASDALVHCERAACYALVRAGFATQAETIHAYGKPGHWEAWAADSILFTIDAIRAGHLHEALRGWGQVREFKGRNGFLPAGLSDAVGVLQNALEDALRTPRAA